MGPCYPKRSLRVLKCTTSYTDIGERGFKRGTDFGALQVRVTVHFMNESQVSNPTHAKLLGELVIAWSNVSRCLEDLFIYLADIDDAYVAGVFVEKIRDGQLDEVVSSLAAQLETSARDAIRAWIKRVKVARKKRNEYLHGVYVPMEHNDGALHLYLLAKRVLDRQSGTAQPNLNKLRSDNLRTFHVEIEEIQQSYERLLKDHFPFELR